jgi:hypothetical protein
MVFAREIWKKIAKGVGNFEACGLIPKMAFLTPTLRVFLD